MTEHHRPTASKHSRRSRGALHHAASLVALALATACTGGAADSTLSGGSGGGDGGVGQGGGAPDCDDHRAPTWVKGYGPQWYKSGSKPLDSSDHAIATGVALDATGNIFVVGVPPPSDVDFGGGALSPTGAPGDREFYLIKLTPTGEHLWSRRFATGPIFNSVPSIVVDTTGNPVVGGAFLGTIDFGAGPLSSEVMTPSQFVVKFDPAGNPIWSKKLAGYLGAVPLAAGPTGSVIVAPTEASPYVVKLDTSGVELWKRTWSCSSTCSLSGLALAAGDHVVVLGTFEGTTDLGAGTLTSAGREDMFLARLDASGSTLWSESFGADGVDRGGHAAVDFADHIVVTGWTKTGESMGRLDLGGGPLKGADDKNSAFLAKLDYQGGHVWSVRVGDASDLGYLGTPAVDDDNNLVVPAWLNTMDIGCGPSGSGTFVVKFDALGNRVWDARLSDDQSETEAVPFAAVVRAGSPIVAGTLAGDSGFDFGGAASASGLAFVAEYQP